MKFIDLFSGLGCFHISLSSQGHKCVYACEINNELNNLYEDNYGLKPDYDITKVDVNSIPDHEVLCAGFPCQPFSKAGRQLGIQDDRGNLINVVIEILKVKKTKYFILENVRNLEKHNFGLTWIYIKDELEKLGYSVDKKILSPHQIGIPQHRERIFIVGSLDGLNHFEWFNTHEVQKTSTDISKISSKIITELEAEKIRVLNIWQKFLDCLPSGIKPYSPLWTMEFGANYPIEEFDLETISIEALRKYKGSFGKRISGNNKDELIQKLPNYIKKQRGKIPKWKQNYIKNNRQFYLNHKLEIDKILPEIIGLNNESWQKLEWNCGFSEKNLWNNYIQFRGSGIRIKKKDFFPSLVTVSTQIPIIASEKRYLSIDEAKFLQSIPDVIKLPQTNASAFKALGNAINVSLINYISINLLK